MNQAEEDALILLAMEPCDLHEAIRRTIRAAHEAGRKDERKDRRCSITGNQCGTDTWASTMPPDCHCGRMFAQSLAETRAAVAHERERCAAAFGDSRDELWTPAEIAAAIAAKGEA